MSLHCTFSYNLIQKLLNNICIRSTTLEFFDNHINYTLAISLNRPLSLVYKSLPDRVVSNNYKLVLFLSLICFDIWVASYELLSIGQLPIIFVVEISKGS